MPSVKEKWKQIQTHPNYEVSNHGRVRRGKKIIGVSLSNTGYEKVNLGGPTVAARTQTLHRLVAKAFLPNPEGHAVVHHKDANKINNHVRNLEWCSYSQNSKYTAGDRCIVRTKPKTRAMFEEMILTQLKVNEKQLKEMRQIIEERCFDD